MSPVIWIPLLVLAMCVLVPIATFVGCLLGAMIGDRMLALWDRIFP